MRVLAIFAASFAAGIFLAQYLLPTQWLLPCAVVCFVLSCGSLLLKRKQRRRVFLACIALTLALGWNWLYVRQIQQPAQAVSGKTSSAVMTLVDYAVPTDSGAKVTVRIEGIPGKGVYYGDAALLELQPGQTVKSQVYFQDAARIRDDDVTTFTSKGVFLLAYARGEAEYGEGSVTSVRWLPLRIGRLMRERLSSLFEGDIAAFLTAILTGDKSGLSVQAAADLSEAGLYHILAVSGMHCGFLLIMVTALVGKHRRKSVAGLTILLLLFYAVLTGGSPSVLRACIMLTLYLLAPLFGRESDGTTALATALFLILLKNPFAAASVSLQLSFAAMAGILWLTPRLWKLLSGQKKHDKVFRFIVTGFSATVGALVFTLPLSAFYFESVTLVSPLSNLVCLWAASLIFILGLAAVFLGLLVPPLGYLLALPVRVLTGFVLTAAHLLAELPYHAVYLANPYLKYWLIFLYVLFAAAWLLRGGGKRKYLLATVLAAISLSVTLHLGQTQYDANLDVVVLDVGQGQCVLLTSDETYALVDCGSSNSWYGPGEIAGQQLAALGCKKLDYLILTHFDEDHINGISELIARMDVGTVLVPGTDECLTELEGEADAVQIVAEICTVDLGLADLTVIPPVGEDESNERGLSVLAAAGNQEILLTGDMSSSTEKTLLERYALPDIEILVAGHHGSKHSTSALLLESLTPETVCISVGKNSYGHPAEETMRRIAKQGCAIYRTDLHGNIHISLNN